MLGETLSDPYGIEVKGSMHGLGLLPMDTVFEQEKTRTRVTGTFLDLPGDLAGLAGTPLEGYEIHMGSSVAKEGTGAAVSLENYADSANEKSAVSRKNDGAALGNVYGTYVHGVFDKEGVARKIVQALGKKKGIDTTEIAGIDFQEFKETQYDILAEQLRKHLDMEKIYEILNQGV